MNPLAFNNVLHHIRRQFSQADICCDLTAVANHRLPRDLVRAAVAVLVHEGVLRWTEDARLVRADAPQQAIVRRTA
jgi:hypothetical protein